MQQLPPIIHETWHKHLQPLFDDPKMIMIKDEVLSQSPYYPERKDIFRVFSMPLNEIKVVILGQDPYANGEAVGLSFAVNSAESMPASLRIIKGEIENKDTLWYFKKYEDAMWKTLTHWVQQGVFLLNTALTVQQGITGSHLGYWYWFTREVIKIISAQTKPVWLLWGAKAKGFKDFIECRIVVTRPEEQISGTTEGFNFILEADHPAAETYPNSKAKFTGCNHFNLCNKILVAKNQSQIKW
jgi:uracil-DNA glycosylase